MIKIPQSRNLFLNENHAKINLSGVGFLVPSPSLSGFVTAGGENGEDDDWDGDKVESRIVDVPDVGAVSDHDSFIFAHVTAIGNA